MAKRMLARMEATSDPQADEIREIRSHSRCWIIGMQFSAAQHIASTDGLSGYARPHLPMARRRQCARQSEQEAITLVTKARDEEEMDQEKEARFAV